MKNAQPLDLVDRFHRQVNYLRISITDRCNLRCRYCAPSLPKPLKKEKLLGFAEIKRLVRIGSDLGITKIRLTGGEPLCRKGVVGFIEDLHRIAKLKDISLTTNGTLLAHKAARLKAAGLSRINISLDTLDQRKYRELTGADRFESVLNGINQAAEMGFDPIKINVVVMKGFNDDEIEEMAELTLRYPLHIRFIEYMPIGTDPQQAYNYFIPSSTIHSRLARLAPLTPVSGSTQDGPAQRFRFAGAPGEIGLISAMSAHFCRTCNRLRLTADGKLRPCLLSEATVDIADRLQNDASDEELTAGFLRAIRLKKEKHRMTFAGNRKLQTKMVSIGG